MLVASLQIQNVRFRLHLGLGEDDEVWVFCFEVELEAFPIARFLSSRYSAYKLCVFKTAHYAADVPSSESSAAFCPWRERQACRERLVIYHSRQLQPLKQSASHVLGTDGSSGVRASLTFLPAAFFEGFSLSDSLSEASVLLRLVDGAIASARPRQLGKTRGCTRIKRNRLRMLAVWP